MANWHAYHTMLQVIGALGSLMYIGGYLLVQSGRICGNGIGYTLSKLVAASCVLSSLATAFNLASFLIQVSFIAISAFGIWYRISGRRASRVTAPSVKTPEPRPGDDFRAAALSPRWLARNPPRPAPEGLLEKPTRGRGDQGHPTQRMALIRRAKRQSRPTPPAS